jgi:SAM-dependent methyltransferase
MDDNTDNSPAAATGGVGADSSATQEANPACWEGASACTVATSGSAIQEATSGSATQEANPARDAVSRHYGEVARASSCCTSAFSTLYDPETIASLPPQSIKASRGCADPHAFAALQPGERVLDLGSGGGIDCLLAAREVGEMGSVIGLDMTDDMLALARSNAEKAGLSNVEFVRGYIEDVPFEDGSFDVVISNCVINLSTDKPAVLREAFRVLALGGRFVVADVVALRRMDERNAQLLAQYVGCTNGVMVDEDYRGLLEQIGFVDVSIEPINVYVKTALQASSRRIRLKEIYDQIDFVEADAAFAGSIVIAHKR